MKKEKIMIRDAWVGGGNVFPAPKNCKNMSLHFSSARAFVDYCENTKPNKGCKVSSNRKGNSSWCDAATYKEAIRQANEGNPKLTASIVAKREEMRIGLLAEQATFKDELLPSGAVPDVPMYLTGEACHMQNFDIEEDKPIIKIAFAGSFNCNIRDETVYNYGAALMNVIDEIESAGIATVQLSVFYASQYDNGRNLTTFPVKIAGEEMIEDDVAFFVASASSFRRLGFRTIESLPNKAMSVSETHSGYGRCTPITNIDFDDWADDFDVLIDLITENKSPSQIREQLIESFRASQSVSSLIVGVGE